MQAMRSRGGGGGRRGGSANLFELTSVLLDAFEAWKFGAQDDEYDPLMEEARRNVWLLRKAYEHAADEGATSAFLAELRRVVGSTAQAKRAFVAWMQLIDALIQAAEKEYGTAAGRGEVKKTQVKAAIIRLLLDTSNLRLPVPPALQPFVIEAGVGWAIDTVTGTLDQHHLWDAKNPEPKRNALSRRVDRMETFFAQRKPLERCTLWIRSWGVRIVIARNPLNDDIRKAVEEVERTEGVGIDGSLRAFADFATWLSEHGPQVSALFALVGTAVQDAESFLKMRPGRERKEYARDLIVAFLESVGILREGDLLEHVVDGALDWFIDAIVEIFSRHAPAFRHTRRRRPRPA
jgi:hypothetical protein